MKEYHREISKMNLETTGNIETEANELRRRNKIGLRIELMFKTVFQRVFKTMFEKLKRQLIKTSFLKNTDPKKRDFIVNDFHNTRHIIQQNFLSERVGDLRKQYELSKLFKTVFTDKQKDVRGLVSELKPIREGMKNLPKAITFLQFPSITAYGDDGEEEEDVFIGDFAKQYLRKFASKSGTDKTFGLRDKNGKFYIGNKAAKIKENNIIVVDKEYAVTPRLCELIVATTAVPTIILPCDPVALVERLYY